MWSNCLLYACGQFLRHGGYLEIRWSDYGPWPHADWTADRVIYCTFTPDTPKHRRRFPPLLFKGHVVCWTR